MCAQAIPTSDINLYDGQTLAEPYETYRALRDLGPVVWLDRMNVHVVSRDADVRRVLGDPDTFRQNTGVVGRVKNTIMSDGETHTRFRKVIADPMRPKALAELRPSLQTIADDLADRLVALESFDAVKDLAEVIPSTWVPDLVGWPEEGRENLLPWSRDILDSVGQLGARDEAAARNMGEMFQYVDKVAAQHNFPEGSMGAAIFAAMARGEIDATECPGLLGDYLVPSLDTTISALGNAIWLFGTHPEQWDLLRREPARARNAFNEVLRMESPVVGFTRHVSRDADVDGVTVPSGSKVLVLYPSANRDERRWERPDEFDITRDASTQIAFGYGVHTCVGMGLARLEGAALLAALIPRVERFVLGEATRLRHNQLRAFASLPTTIQPVRQTSEAASR